MILKDEDNYPIIMKCFILKFNFFLNLFLNSLWKGKIILIIVRNYSFLNDLTFFQWNIILKSIKILIRIDAKSALIHFEACIRHSLFKLFLVIAENQLLEKLIVSVNLLSSIQFINTISRSISSWIVRVCANPSTVCWNKISIWENFAIVCPTLITKNISHNNPYIKITAD